MQIKYLPKEVYKLYHYACIQTTKSEQIERRRKFLDDWEILKNRKVPEKEIAKITGISRATYYRLKKSLSIYGLRGLEKRSKRPKKFRQSKIPKETIEIVLNIRKQNPTYGKDKINIILKRDFAISLSVSSVGRLIKNFKEKGLIIPSYARVRKRRKRIFKEHAKPWQYGIKIDGPGQMVQIDHMVVNKNQLHFKHFQAWDPYTKSIVAEVYSDATSVSAKKFLSKVIATLPFKVQSIQVDGGSEFMSHFEQACADNDIKLFVLPPKRPQYNGGVERANRTLREEFYGDHRVSADSVGAMRIALQLAISKYNSYRPHHSLGGLTPLQYTNQYLMCRQSHML
jgi:transposase InsO family protein